MNIKLIIKIIPIINHLINSPQISLILIPIKIYINIITKINPIFNQISQIIQITNLIKKTTKCKISEPSNSSKGKYNKNLNSLLPTNCILFLKSKSPPSLILLVAVNPNLRIKHQLPIPLNTILNIILLILFTINLNSKINKTKIKKTQISKTKYIKISKNINNLI